MDVLWLFLEEFENKNILQGDPGLASSYHDSQKPALNFGKVTRSVRTYVRTLVVEVAALDAAIVRADRKKIKGGPCHHTSRLSYLTSI